MINAGSSSLKLRVVREEDLAADGGVRDGSPSAGLDLPALDPTASSSAALDEAIERLGPVDAVGHRVVHGGTAFREAARVGDAVVAQLEALTALAPLHQPRSIGALRAARRALPRVPHVACFDTAFHATIPEAAATYALPEAWRRRWPIRRFGFHGLSHAYAARRAAQVLGRAAGNMRLVTAHLGAGASLAAVANGRSVDTTMGFTPLEGLVMATRAGSVDPGLVLWLLQRAGLTPDEVSNGLEHESGILGLGGSADMRDVLAGADSGSAPASLARDVYVHALRSGIAAMAASMGGLDGLVFTGGVGENAPVIRSLAIEGLGFLGLSVDAARNERPAGDREIGMPGNHAAVVVVASREELEIAGQVRSLLGRH